MQDYDEDIYIWVWIMFFCCLEYACHLVPSFELYPSLLAIEGPAELDIDLDGWASKFSLEVIASASRSMPEMRHNCFDMFTPPPLCVVTEVVVISLCHNHLYSLQWNKYLHQSAYFRYTQSFLKYYLPICQWWWMCECVKTNKNCKACSLCFCCSVSVPSGFRFWGDSFLSFRYKLLLSAIYINRGNGTAISEALQSPSEKSWTPLPRLLLLP